MKTINEVKAEKTRKVDQLISDCSMFFAFSNEQFAANKTPKEEGEKYVSLGCGAYMPKSKVDVYLNGMKVINKWYKSAIKKDNLRRENIIYQLSNFEAFYTGDIDDTMDALGPDYTRAEVYEVYNTEREKQIFA